MSAKTRADVDEAIRAHIGDESGGAVITAWQVTTASVHPTKDKVTFYSYMDNDLPWHTAVGLESWAGQHLAAMGDADE